MDFDYTNLGMTAVRLIEKFGAPARITSFVDIPNPNRIDPPIRTPNNVDTKAVFTKYKLYHIDGQQIKAGDQLVLVAGKIDPTLDTAALKLNGIVHRMPDGEKWKVIDIQIVQPGPTALLYKIQVRR